MSELNTRPSPLYIDQSQAALHSPDNDGSVMEVGTCVLKEITILISG